MPLVSRPNKRALTRSLLAAGALSVAACDRGGASEESRAPNEDEALLAEELPEGGLDPVENAGALVMQGQAAEGLRAVDDALTRQPRNAELHFVRGMALQALGRGDEAIAAWERAVEISPRMFGALDGIGSVHLDAGRLDEAEIYFRKALELSPTFAGAQFNLGVVALRRGDETAAAAAFAAATELDPKDASAWLELAALHARQGDDIKARAAVLRAVEAAPGDPYVQAVAGDVAAADGDLAAAATAYAAALQAAPEAPEAVPLRVKLVRVLLRAERAEEALPHSEAVVAAASEAAVPWSDHGGVLLALGRHEEALEALDRALAIEPGLASAHRRRVRAWVDGKDCAKAKAAAETFAKVTGADAAQVKGARADARACR